MDYTLMLRLAKTVDGVYRSLPAHLAPENFKYSDKIIIHLSETMMCCFSSLQQSDFSHGDVP